MKYFVRLIVFVMSVFVPASMFALIPAATVGDKPGGLEVTAVCFCVGAFVGFMFSGRAMDSVAGKLPKDEQ